jgi:hypothetical protein
VSLAGLTFREPMFKNDREEEISDDDAGGYGVIGDAGTLVEEDCEFCL